MVKLVYSSVIAAETDLLFTLSNLVVFFYFNLFHPYFGAKMPKLHIQIKMAMASEPL